MCGETTISDIILSRNGLFVEEKRGDSAHGLGAVVRSFRSGRREANLLDKSS